ncbi:Interferon-induced very large GTPase 1 [Labeo rohita]|uniref:Interferon-induced very large GTPase 1 n=1 Tax=Labeo rohita TaxID=84645 RepID=A0ABQ8MYV7_LABRO|nr:Interferon-induced very large GTPase 1 [Labeo rohita]
MDNTTLEDKKERLKSQLINSLINDKHNTFFHRNCPGSSRTRVLMNGVVEIAWFCPSGKNDDKFTNCVAFCNLHSDAGEHEKQLDIMTEMASVNVAFLSELNRNDIRMTKIQNLYKDPKPLICLLPENGLALTEMGNGTEIENKLQNQIENGAMNVFEKTDLHGKLNIKYTEVKKSMSEFFEKDTNASILIQWKTSFKIKVSHIQENIIMETQRKLNVVLQQRVLKKEIDAQRTQNENTLLEKAKDLALTLKNKAKDDKILQREFDSFWNHCMKYDVQISKLITDVALQGATSATIIGEIICNKLKEPIQQSVYKKTAQDLADELRSNCESLNGNRSNLEKHILKTLAEKEDFETYITYIHNPKEHFKSFIRNEVSQYITTKFNISVLPKMKDDLRQKENQIKEAVQRASEWVDENSGDADLWLKIFTLNLSDVLIFSEKNREGVSRDDVDVKLLGEPSAPTQQKTMIMFLSIDLKD